MGGNHMSVSEEVKKQFGRLAEAVRKRIRHLVEIYYDVQDVRKRSDSRLQQIGEVKGVNPKILKELEKQIREYIKFEIADLQIVKDYLKMIRGMGPILAGGLISYFDPYKADHASSFWKYAGLAPEKGEAVMRHRKEKLPYNPRAQVLCWKVADSFVKHRTPFYRDLYDQVKPVEEAKLNHPFERIKDEEASKEKKKTVYKIVNDPKKCPLFPEQCSAWKKMVTKAKRQHKSIPPLTKVPCAKHVDYRARRKMVKRFLADFWVVWRRFEGLPVSKPYAHRNE